MKVIEPEVKVLDKLNLSAYQIIERIGRTCYKSEDSITDDSAIRFVSAMKKNRHYAMLEHYHLIFDCTPIREQVQKVFAYPQLMRYLNVTNKEDLLIVSGSFRAFLELFELKKTDDRLSGLRRIEEKCKGLYPDIFPAMLIENEEDNITYYTRTEFQSFIQDRPDEKELAFRHLTHTLLFICDRGVSHEFVRHRPASFAQESTRYCCYAKGKFGGEITVIKPCFFEEDMPDFKIWTNACMEAEHAYFDLLNNGRTPQEARDVLPTSLKTDLVITATEEEWKHIIELRYQGITGKPHPQMVEVMQMAYEKLVKESNGRLAIEGKE